MKTFFVNLFAVLVLVFCLLIQTTSANAADTNDSIKTNSSSNPNTAKDEGPCCDNGYAPEAAPAMMKRESVPVQKYVEEKSIRIESAPLGKEVEGPCCDNGLTVENPDVQKEVK